MSFEIMFFDLDDTIYPPNTGIWQAIGSRMDQYMIDKLTIPAESVTELREELFKKHGTTLRGLVAEYQIHDQDFLDYVHDIPVDKFLSRNERLIETLESYPQRKVIFTNADINHAHRVLSTLGVLDFFDQIIDICAIRPYCKPMDEAFTMALALAGVQNPSNCVMIDDAHRNLVAASSKGLFTIQVGTENRNPMVDAAILTITDLPSVIPISNGA